MDPTLWESVKKRPKNPHLWTELCFAAERSNDYDEVIRAYEGFLQCFPLLHNYWNKLALAFHAKEGTTSKPIECFKRAISEDVLKYSVEMWFLYLTYVKQHDLNFTEQAIRSLFEDAIAAVGSDYNSDKIWNLYLETETDPKQIESIFSRVLVTPINNLPIFWEAFNKFSSSSNTIENFFSSKDFIENHRKALEDAEVLSKYELKITKNTFQFQIPSNLERAVWYEYLSFIENSNNTEKTIHLYERSLIPFYLVPEMWIRYAKFFLKIDQKDRALSVLDRALVTQLKDDPRFQKMRAQFMESSGELEIAKRIYSKLGEYPDDPNAVIAYASYLSRENQQQESIEALKKFCDRCQNPTHYVAAALHFPSAKYVNVEYLKTNCTSVPHALGLLVKHYQDMANNDKIKESYEHFLFNEKSRMSIQDKLSVIPIYLNFLRGSGADPEEITRIKNAYQELQKSNRIWNIKEKQEEVKYALGLDEMTEIWKHYLEKVESSREAHDSN